MNVDLANLSFNLANILFVFGSLSLILDFIKKPMRYKIWSTLFTAIALLCVNVAYLNLDNLLSLVLSIPNTTYWTIATVYSIVQSIKIRKRKSKIKTLSLLDIKYGVNPSPNDDLLKKIFEDDGW